VQANARKGKKNFLHELGQDVDPSAALGGLESCDDQKFKETEKGQKPPFSFTAQEAGQKTCRMFG